MMRSIIRREWSGEQHPSSPAHYWRDDETHEAVCAYCSHRAATIETVVHGHGCDNPDKRD